ncbi:DMT family transporter [Lichenihabitans sp. PAMC28606]|uniref:DMT family transporter n=1 Tax=Lichenihabitans sp. PAMC28606 TaxID=2880932 RepID=UPI001D0BAE2D|nr:DMT family transporter [Lichenihabitans sp. PAMC28606]UDL93894.1 DMT family transporter [Lichenihabitans sp. PAMC28606]
MPILIAVIVLLTGALNTVQAGANATLNKVLQAPVFALFTVTAANCVVYLLAGTVVGFIWPESGRLAQVPWWGWIGGAFGGLYVIAMVFLAQKLGSAMFTGLSVTAAILTSVLLDHFGLVGFEQHSASLWRVTGCLLMIGGLTLVCVF